MEEGRQTQVNPGLGKLHSYIAYGRMMALNIGQSREISFGEVLKAHVPTRSLQAWTEAPGGGERFWPTAK
jgi:hypothetical protein